MPHSAPNGKKSGRKVCVWRGMFKYMCLMFKYTHKQEVSERIYQKLIMLVLLPVGSGKG